MEDLAEEEAQDLALKKSQENVEAVRSGASTNLARHIRNMSRFGVPVIASVNIFPTDTDAEVQALLDEAKKAGAMDAVISRVHAEGGEGGADLARAVVTACQSHIADGRPFEPSVRT